MKGFDIIKFGKRLTYARNKTGYSMNEVRDKTGIAQSQICQYEKGRVKPSISQVYSLAVLYNVGIDWLCGMEDD